MLVGEIDAQDGGYAVEEVDDDEGVTNAGNGSPEKANHSSSQYHQHFMSNFFTNFFLPKNYKHKQQGSNQIVRETQRGPIKCHTKCFLFKYLISCHWK